MDIFQQWRWKWQSSLMDWNLSLKLTPLRTGMVRQRNTTCHIMTLAPGSWLALMQAWQPASSASRNRRECSHWLQGLRTETRWKENLKVYAFSTKWLFFCFSLLLVEHLLFIYKWVYFWSINIFSLIYIANFYIRSRQKIIVALE